MSEAAPRILAVIPARGGSRRLPGKNLRPLLGKPLLAHTLEAALANRHLFADLVVSTDDPEIAEAARSRGVRVPFRRPPELAVDGAPLAPVLRQALGFLEAQAGAPFDWICWLSPTYPLRQAGDIAAAVALARAAGAGDGDAVIAVAPTAENLAVRLRRVEGGRVQPFYRTPDGGEPDPRSFPPAFRRAGGIVLLRREALLRGALFGDDPRPLVLPAERALEIRDELDLERAEALLAPPLPPAAVAVRPAPPALNARAAERMLLVVLPPAGPPREPGGGLQPLAGKKLAAWAFETAGACRKLFSKIVVASADHEIGQLARSLGLEVPFRLPPELAGDGVPAAAVLAHALRTLEPRGGAAYDWLCVLRAGFPLLTPGDLQRAATLAAEGGGDSVAALQPAPELHPLFLKKIAGGRLLPYTVPEPPDLRPEDARPAAFLPSEALALVRRAPLLERGVLRGAAPLPLELPAAAALDAALPADLALADRLLRRRPAAGR